ncbi:hypothetical protein PV325_008983 [Microctonus aethiopoides]|uniref:Spaetzle domain-containing protein n=1 Tax=Microctonus aethiopoides TaxID=144406 RepID=A0AA39FN98_9HYME|nr:hypothetical protein PV325_008983 [Microctonus aethiopoides]KAK0172770.1 hypothetical protein PV328_006048 [Microctonus aethiopoides]
MKAKLTCFLISLAFLHCTSSTESLDDNKDEYQSGEKISTSLMIVEDVLKNQTDFIQPVTSSKLSSSSFSSLKNVALISNISRENTTRDLILTTTDDDSPMDDEELPETLPDALELRHLRPINRGRRPYYRPRPRPPSANRRNVYPNEAPLRPVTRPNRKQIDGKREPTEKDCNFFSKTVCLKTLNYPQEAIIRSIRNNKNMASALLKDYNFQSDDRNDDNSANDILIENRFENNEIKKRSDYPSPYDNVEEGFTCPSQVMYARPQLARAASGIWKYIINTGEHTQTLRLEKCSKPKASCSFISENYRSSCVQVYNYHRLLTWDNNLGLHMDIFKIPSCCSCHIHGYTELYPPNQKNPKQVEDENYPGAEYTTDQGGDQSFERPSSYLTKQRPSAANLDSNNHVGSGSKQIVDASSSNRPSFVLPVRPSRPKKPAGSTSIPRPFDKLPQQHAPNTRAPGYKGLIIKSASRPSRPNRPYRRESTSDFEDSSSSNLNWFSQPFDEESDAATRLHSADFSDDYQEPNRRINYNYHPIIDFFKPEASMLQQASEPSMSTQISTLDINDNTNSWKPMISSP